MNNLISKNLIVVDIKSNIYEVADTMKRYDVGFVPVSDNNKIVGVLTDRDIVTKIVANKDELIESYINKPISIDLNDSIENALTLMSKHKIKRLLVSSNNKLVGILSISDLLNTDYNYIKAIKEIFEINKNDDTYITKVDEFYL
jgi:CBS domain-containing protein